MIMAVGAGILAILWTADAGTEMRGLLPRVLALGATVLLAGMVFFDLRDLYVLPRFIRWGLWYDIWNLSARYLLLLIAWGGISLFAAMGRAGDVAADAGPGALAMMVVAVALIYPRHCAGG